MQIGDVVMNGRYRIVSLPYQERCDAYNDIAKFWQGIDCTTWYCTKTNEWYIIEPE